MVDGVGDVYIHGTPVVQQWMIPPGGTPAIEILLWGMDKTESENSGQREHRAMYRSRFQEWSPPFKYAGPELVRCLHWMPLLLILLAILIPRSRLPKLPSTLQLISAHSCSGSFHFQIFLGVSHGFSPSPSEEVTRPIQCGMHWKQPILHPHPPGALGLTPIFFCFLFIFYFVILFIFVYFMI